MARPWKLPPKWSNGEPTAIEWAVLAGFFAGDGCAQINHPHHTGSRCQTFLSIRQADPRPLVWVLERFGGRIRETRHGRGAFSEGKRIFVWSVSSYGEVERLARGMHPYCPCPSKKRQLALVANAPYQPVEVQLRMLERCRTLKRERPNLEDS